MKTYLSRFFLLSTLLLLFFTLPTQAAVTTYTLDPNHTYVLWHINHFGFSNPAGKWIANGTLVLDKDKPQNSKVNATILVSNMVTGLPELDKHLKTDLFFNTDKYPTATFVSDKVTVTSKTSAKVHGLLTVHGIAKPVTLNVKLNSIAISPITNKETAGFSAFTTLKRSDFGITTLLPGLSDDVKIEIEAEGIAN